MIHNNLLEEEKMSDLDEILINYKGTLSTKDQKIFLELKRYDHVNFNLINDDGYIEIGKLRKKKSNGLIRDDRSTKKVYDEQSTIDEETKPKKIISNERILNQFLRQFKPSLIKLSIFNFPLEIKLDQSIDYDLECIDPRFQLLSFYHLINRRKINLEEFIDHNCLSITFVSLSFKDENLRRLGYMVLMKIKQNLCDDNYGTIWRLIFDKLIASLKDENQWIPPLITSFFVHLIPFIQKPIYSINEQITKFLTVHSSFRFQSIVAFILSWFTIDNQEKINFYQEIALSVLINGLKTDDDFNLCLNGKVMDFLMINYSSSILFEANVKRKILDFFKLIARQPQAIRLMSTEKAFLFWLNQLIIDTNQIEILNKLNQIICQIDEMNYDFYPLFQIELKMIKKICRTKLDHLFEQDDL